jgi:hypothetical protein
MNDPLQETDTIKNLLFNYLSNKKEIQELIIQSKFSDISENVLENCFEKIIKMGKKEESLGTFATSLLHYLLTRALISSQRKIETQDIQLDIVIPNVKTLKKDPKNSLVICIPKTTNKKEIEQKLKTIQKIQPHKENIWLVLTKNMNFKNRIFVIKKNNSSFSNIINEISLFINVKGPNKFKILPV